jgi:plastocyanin
MRRRHGIALSGLAALVLAAVAGAEDTKLSGTVGPGFTITLKDAQGADVTKLPAGAVEIAVADRSEEHNFHLSGPGVDVTTGVEAMGDTIFRVTLGDGRYRFVCDVHPSSMAGLFDVGAGAPPPTTTTPAPSPAPTATPSARVGARLSLSVGPAATISLKTLAGKNVTLLRPGAYTIVARDRSTTHNARLRGAGATQATGVPFVGTKTWRVVLRKGRLVVLCDAHRTTMRKTVTVA